YLRVRLPAETMQLLRHIFRTARKPGPSARANRKNFDPSRDFCGSAPGLRRSGARGIAATRYLNQSAMKAGRVQAPALVPQWLRPNVPSRRDRESRTSDGRLRIRV